MISKLLKIFASTYDPARDAMQAPSGWHAPAPKAPEKPKDDGLKYTTGGIPYREVFEQTEKGSAVLTETWEIVSSENAGKTGRVSYLTDADRTAIIALNFNVEKAAALKKLWAQGIEAKAAEKATKYSLSVVQKAFAAFGKAEKK